MAAPSSSQLPLLPAPDAPAWQQLAKPLDYTVRPEMSWARVIFEQQESLKRQRVAQPHPGPAHPGLVPQAQPSRAQQAPPGYAPLRSVMPASQQTSAPRRSSDGGAGSGEVPVAQQASCSGANAASTAAPSAPAATAAAPGAVQLGQFSATSLNLSADSPSLPRMLGIPDEPATTDDTDAAGAVFLAFAFDGAPDFGDKIARANRDNPYGTWIISEMCSYRDPEYLMKWLRNKTEEPERKEPNYEEDTHQPQPVLKQ
ncbi:hypothetical protein GPECTOR_17g843 [Gonium pectorale]|uniref:Uncharacterized protein n=1 Tax=Gonium pectorale TaxID=33097 RepID=A0A150GK44_GONPE|nr:hypothetical protein GPECTOR_17g843 [Gonium pectorale]|eukprot:KXZ50206.1 hypothetical protein GPECTOR_17g843 [Gonium pectorale]